MFVRGRREGFLSHLIFFFLIFTFSSTPHVYGFAHDWPGHCVNAKELSICSCMFVFMEMGNGSSQTLELQKLTCYFGEVIMKR